MAVTEQAVALSVLGRWSGWTKRDRHDSEIGTLETSNLPYEDCCTVFTPRHPKTKPQLEKILEIEQAIPFEELEREAAENCEMLVISSEYDG